MEMPGGLYRKDGSVEKEWAFRPLNGHTELALWDAWQGSTSKVDRVTRAIASTIELPDEDEGQDANAAGLCVADRQFLLAQLACHFGASRFWVSADCTFCHKWFDAPVDLARLPVKPAAEGYPFAEAAISTGKVVIRAPTGLDQAAIQDIDDDRQALLSLVRHCIVTEDGAEAEPAALIDEDIEAIDRALQCVVPEVAAAVTTSCPQCKMENTTRFDALAPLQSGLRNPLEEVHDIAATYHWSERDILNLPRQRRLRYLALIDQCNGVQR